MFGTSTLKEYLVLGEIFQPRVSVNLRIQAITK